MKFLAQTVVLLRRSRRRALMLLLAPLFKRHGRNFRFDPDGDFSYSTISVGNDVFIGLGATFQASESGISIGDKVMFGPNVTILGGDHNTSQSGQFMADVKAKRPENDQPVVVEEDVWVGAEATILKGVRVGRGAIIGAGSVVTKSVPPYAVMGGNPARVLKWRWPVEQALAHEELLYPADQRLSREELSAGRAGGNEL